MIEDLCTDGIPMSKGGEWNITHREEDRLVDDSDWG